jgi:hypothetical protein
MKTKITLEAKRLGIDLIGFASNERFDNAPPKRKPTDIMTEAKTVIVLALRRINGPVINNHWTSYTPVHNGNDFRLNNAAYYLSCFIEENYCANAIPISANAPYSGQCCQRDSVLRCWKCREFVQLIKYLIQKGTII